MRHHGLLLIEPDAAGCSPTIKRHTIDGRQPLFRLHTGDRTMLASLPCLRDRARTNKQQTHEQEGHHVLSSTLHSHRPFPKCQNGWVRPGGVSLPRLSGG